MSLYSDLRATWKTIQRVRRSRHLRSQFFATLEERGQLPDGVYDAAVYFADTPRNMYQVRQWYRPFEELDKAHRVVIISRSMRTVLLLLEETSLDVQYAPTVSDIEEFMDRQPLKAVFYPNQNAKNFHCLRNHGPAHIWINHGESDKSSMTTNQVKAYDQVFVAGQAAKDRLKRNVINFDVDRYAVPTGRPQIDVIQAPPTELVTDHRKLVLYSPTWEGDRPSMAYSSIVSHGRALVEALTNSPEHRLIFRSHPSTGKLDKVHKKALNDLRRMIEEANESDPTAHHMIDVSPSFSWQLKLADYCIADVSAIAFDWLATRKPIFVARPVSPDAHIEAGGLISQLPLLESDATGEIIAKLEQYGSRTQELADLSEYYFGDTTPGASMDLWLKRATEAIVERGAVLQNLDSHEVGIASDQPEATEISKERSS